MTAQQTSVARGDPAHTIGASSTGHYLPASGAAWFIGLSVALAAAGAAASSTSPALVPFALALGPAAIAIGLAWRERRGALRQLLHSVTVRPASRRWYLVLVVPILWALGVDVVAVVGGQVPGGLFDGITPAAVAIPLVVLLPAFAEELAWRGFALPRALALMSPIKASLLLAIPWTLLHLVLQLPGGINAAVSTWPTIVSVAAYSVLLTWVYLGTGGSVLMSALVHTGLNGVVPLMWGVNAEAAWEIRAVLAAVIALAVLTVSRPGTPLDARLQNVGGIA
jgi:uncharacterized protein